LKDDSPTAHDISNICEGAHIVTWIVPEYDNIGVQANVGDLSEGAGGVV
jgi:hypothetical protein